MKITNFILPIVALTVLNNNNQVRAWGMCEQDCTTAHTMGQALCSYILEPISQTACRVTVATAYIACVASC